MGNGYTRSPKLLKGALVELSERFIGPVPNIIVFQYNPETLTRELTAWQPPGEAGGKANGPSTAQPTDPPEEFTLTLELDATDDLEMGDSVAVVSGVADRIAALEMLLYPQEGSLLGGLLGSASDALSAVGESKTDKLPRGSVPIVLFVWGPGRIVPVRLTSFSVEEQAYSPTLYPIRAKVSLGLKVLAPDDLKGHWDASSRKLAEFAFKLTRKQKQVLAAANVADNVESILGLLPF
jgi:hypothetical protein